MKYELYQVDMNKANEIAFMPYNSIDTKKVWFMNYKMVNEGELDVSEPVECLSLLWKEFNGAGNTEYKHRSMSVSDVVILYYDGFIQAYYCDSFGWEKVDYKKFFRDVYETAIRTSDIVLHREKELIKKLADIYNEFTKLYSQHPNELSDFADGIHKCQYVLAMRMAREHYPDLFPYKLDKD